MSRLREITQVVGGILLIASFTLIPIALIWGMLWVSGVLLPFVAILGNVALIMLLLVLLPFSLHRRSRRWTGPGIVLVSYTWGLYTWMFSALVVHDMWGTFWMIIGILFFAVGVIPMAGLAMLFRGDWVQAGALVLSIVVIYLVRGFGVWLESTVKKTQQLEAEYETV
jgi:hypothetical protein